MVARAKRLAHVNQGTDRTACGLKQHAWKQNAISDRVQASLSRCIDLLVNGHELSRSALLERTIDSAMTSPTQRHVSEIIKDAKSQLAFLAKRDKASLGAEDAEYRKWVSESKPQALVALHEIVPHNREFDSTLSLLPAANETAFEFAPDVVNACTAALPILEMSTWTAELPMALRSDWEQKHETIMHDECQGLQAALADAEVKPKIVKPPCWMVGSCLCGEEGDDLARLRLRFLNIISKLFKPKTQAREDLLEGKIVVKLHGAREGAGLDEIDDMQKELALLMGDTACSMNIDLFLYLLMTASQEASRLQKSIEH